MTEDDWLRSRRVLQTDEEWRTWDHPYPLVKLLHEKASERKGRLFEAACLRRLWHWPLLQAYRWAVVVLERQADGAATEEEAQSAARALRELREGSTWVMGGMWNQFQSDAEDLHPGTWGHGGKDCRGDANRCGALGSPGRGFGGRPSRR